MNGIFGQLKQSYKSVWVSNSGSVARGMEYSNLAPQQVGVFSADVNSDSKSLTTPSFKTNKRLILKQGIKPFTGQSSTFLSRQDKRQRSSIEFEASDIISFTGLKAQNNPKTEIIAIGYDGLDASKTLSDKLDAKPMHINLRLSGEPIRRFFHTNTITHRIVIDKDLCVGDCECYDECGKVKCDLIADKIVDYINNDYLFSMNKKGEMYQLPLNQFVKAHKIKKCATPLVTPELTEYKKWTISIPDDGNTTISKLASVYKDSKIVLEKREDSVSTYAMWLPATETAVADFTITKHTQPICGSCPDCPDTFTEVDGLKVVKVTVACGVAAPTITGEVSSVLVNSSLKSGDTYVIKVPATTLDSAIEAEIVGCMEGGVVGLEGKTCIGDSVTFSWDACENCFTTEKEFMLTLPDTDCEKGVSRLAELQEAYPDFSVVDYAAGNCSHAYKATVSSNCVAEEDCGRLVTYDFQKPASFEGFNWEEVKPILADPSCEVPAETPEPCCVCGVILETAAWTPTYTDCTYGWSNYHPNDAKPVRLQMNIHSLDYSNNPCDETKTYSTVLQRVKASLGTTGALVQEHERSFLIYENKTWTSNPFSNEIDGFNLVAKPNYLYDQYVLRLKRYEQPGASNITSGYHDYIFYVPTGEGKELETLLNELIFSTGNSELKPVFL